MNLADKNAASAARLTMNCGPLGRCSRFVYDTGAVYVRYSIAAALPTVVRVVDASGWACSS